MTGTDITLPDGRTMPREAFDAALATLSKPFAPSEIEKLPKQMRRNDDVKGECKQGNRQISADGHFCGGYHARSIHLDYVGHAGITMRLNEADPFWTWEPMSYTDHGTPNMTDGGLWIKLTVLGVTRIGYGDPSGKSGPNAIKEVIGDALRNAAMRFGVATYLWSKSEAAAALKTEEDTSTPPPVARGRVERSKSKTNDQWQSPAAQSPAAAPTTETEPTTPPTDPEETAEQPNSDALAKAVVNLALRCDDADKLRGTYRDAQTRQLLEAQVQDYVSDREAALLKLYDETITLGAFLIAAGTYVKAENMSVRDGAIAAG